MNSPDFTFSAVDEIAREQTSSVLVELLQAKDQMIASLLHQNREQERLITALCDRLTGDDTQALPSSLQAVLARFRTH